MRAVTVDCVTFKRRDAAIRLPASATAKKVLQFFEIHRSNSDYPNIMAKNIRFSTE